MADRANVTKTDALEAFRRALIIYQGKANQALSQVEDEIRRTRVWLQTEQRTALQAELKKRQRAMAQAEAELFSAKLSNYLDDTSAQQMGVRKARRALEEVEKKLAAVKSWLQNYDSRVETLGKRLEGFRFMLTHDFPRATALLSELQKSLEAYAEVKRPTDPAGSGPAEKNPEPEKSPSQ
ncbi:hypothetical protein BH23VER1_BH23VER1_25670 [soil metagenome]